LFIPLRASSFLKEHAHAQAQTYFQFSPATTMVLNAVVAALVPPRWRRKPEDGDDPDGSDSRRRQWCGLTGTQVLLSMGSDADVVTDWLYYEESKSKGVPGMVVNLQFLFLLLATAIWLMEVTGGRCFKRPFKRFTGVEATTRNIVKAGVWCEDIPQILLTLLIDGYYASKFSMDGILNLVASGYDGYTKIKALMEDDIEEEETRRYPKKRHLLWSRVGSSRV
jgi:hypothetical protein